MADGGGSRKLPQIPSWQKDFIPSDSKSTPSQPEAKDAPTEPDLDTIERARLLLQTDEAKHATREEKVDLLRKNGFQADEIDNVLDTEQTPHEASASSAEMQTIFDSNDPNTTTSTTLPSRSPHQPPPSSTPPPPTPVTTPTPTPREDLPPIITYPEFLLKPQKPPPLVTIDRLVNAGYILAGISALTWGASKYLVAPMLEALTSARHDLQSSTLTSLEQLNHKLESSVSHVPYIPPLSHQKQQPYTDADDDESTTSDPTELFHRDIATQTTPPSLSRRSSTSSTDSKTNIHNATATQSRHLQNLHSSLSSLLSSTSTNFSTSALNDSVGELQEIIDKIESNSQPLYTAYDWKSAGSSGVTPAWSAATPTPTPTTGRPQHKAVEAQSEAARFKSEIRALKGAFLSSRNFPTARPVAPGASGGGGAAAAARGT